MAAITCDICGGNLSMDASGDFAVCESCGMKHTKDRVKAKAQEITGTVAISNIAGLESLMKRGQLALEDSNWKQADEYFDKVLDIDPEYAPAYIGKLCAELEVQKEEQLVEPHAVKPKDVYDLWMAGEKLKAIKLYREKTGVGLKEAKDYVEAGCVDDIVDDIILVDYTNYQKAVRFADSDYRAILEKYNKTIQERIAEKERQKQEQERQEKERIAEKERIDKERREESKRNLPEHRERIAKYKHRILATGSRTYVLNVDGTVIAAGENDKGQCDVAEWRDIVAVSASYYHTVGLKANGTVVAVGDNEYGQCNVTDWRDIVAISASSKHTVGLKANGTVVAVGDNNEGQCNVTDWCDIVAVIAAYGRTVGLKAHGMVVAVGDNDRSPYNLCDWCDVAAITDWRDIVAISVCGSSTCHIVGLKKDGTVVAVGNNKCGQCNVSDWRDIVAVNSCHEHIYGLKTDGTVVTAGGRYVVTAGGRYQDEHYYVNDWRDIVAIDSCGGHIVGLKSDGTVVSEGAYLGKGNDVTDWRDIVAISASSSHTVGLRTDGTVVAVGENDKGQCNVSREELKKQKEREQKRRESEQKRQEAQQKREREEQSKRWQQQGLCKYCGGQLGGIFTKKCKSCGKEQ
jgi:alpha-tubulin suppressor-like RCC1 family protein